MGQKLTSQKSTQNVVSEVEEAGKLGFMAISQFLRSFETFYYY